MGSELMPLMPSKLEFITVELAPPALSSLCFDHSDAGIAFDPFSSVVFNLYHNAELAVTEVQ